MLFCKRSGVRERAGLCCLKLGCTKLLIHPGGSRSGDAWVLEALGGQLWGLRASQWGCRAHIPQFALVRLGGFIHSPARAPGHAGPRVPYCDGLGLASAKGVPWGTGRMVPAEGRTGTAAGLLPGVLMPRGGAQVSRAE